ncbi:uncharacterized protein FA14DRAFT_152718 [Meira miltonrushii]|uniref:F-box domain-containing protein n=1 Tax=Meira miltonrushii TaxID=1280837 RepID=A0A316VIE9_9BASI|nr:uncharacterized protein FA14DRAFT_152718 [Meira miltonrushii]PWN37316.1 hypothetical protein FA14DRAFT_152718 [Meira miltonrushii]
MSSMLDEVSKLPDEVSKLPNELSAQIFSFFNVFELARLERVSKSWQSMIRTNSTLWKDDQFDAQAFDPCALQHEEKYKAMLKRCDGKIDKVFLPLFLPFNTQAKLKSLLKPLVKSEVKDLWIVIRNDATCPNHHKHYEPKVSRLKLKKQFEDAFEAVLKTVVQCGHLKKLRLVSVPSAIVNITDFGEPTKWPFAAVRLQKLAMHNIRYHSLFPCEELYQTISEAEEIELCFADLTFWNHQKKDCWPFISTANATLKKCRAHYFLDSPYTTPSLPITYKFPQLEQLFLFAEETLPLPPNHPGITKQCFECPKLKVLYAEPSNSTRMIEQLLCNSIEELCIEDLPTEAEDRRRILEKVEKCTKVKKLMFSRWDSIADIKEMCIRLRKAPLEEVWMELLEDEAMIEVKKMVEDRLSDGFVNKIRKATIISRTDQPSKEREWFAKHISDFKSYNCNDPVGQREIMFQQTGLHYFEVSSETRMIHWNTI